MKTLISLSIMAMIISSCCNPCNDKALIKPAVNGCHPGIEWQFSQTVTHYNGTITSSISIVPDPSTGVSTTIADSVITNLYAMATDTVCGIKCISYKGGFSGSCSNPPFPGILFHGFFPEVKDCSPLTTCVFKSMRMTIPDVAKNLRGCNPPKIFGSGEATFIVYCENYAGTIDSSSLTVSFH